MVYVQPFADPVTAELFGDAEMAFVFSEVGFIGQAIEAELALAHATMGLPGVPKPAHAVALSRMLDGWGPAHGSLSAATARDGTPIPALVQAMRAELKGKAEADLIHHGGTTQDIADTALMLQLRRALDILQGRLPPLIAALADLARTHRTTPMVVRTRTQQAAPGTFGLKVATWIDPLIRLREQAPALREQALVAACHGAAGTAAAWGDDAARVARGYGFRTALPVPIVPWFTSRDRVLQVVHWVSLLATALGKIARDVLLLAQTEVAELREGPDADGAKRGGSSTLPHKHNPTRAETVLALCRHVHTLHGGMVAASIHEFERDGVAWEQEWLTLPPLMIAAAAATARAVALVQTLEVDAVRMGTNLALTRGLVLAEAARFALQPLVGRDQALAVVQDAVQAVRADPTLTLPRALEMRCATLEPAAAIDWAAFADPARHLGTAPETVDRLLATV